MYKNHINLDNFNHKLIIIFLEDNKMASPMSFLFLENVKMAPDLSWLYHGGSISCGHMVSPKGLSNRTQGRITCNIQNNNLL
jgi:hypothetical protein